MFGDVDATLLYCPYIKLFVAVIFNTLPFGIWTMLFLQTPLNLSNLWLRSTIPNSTAYLSALFLTESGHHLLSSSNDFRLPFFFKNPFRYSRITSICYEWSEHLNFRSSINFYYPFGHFGLFYVIIKNFTYPFPLGSKISRILFRCVVLVRR